MEVGVTAGVRRKPKGGVGEAWFKEKKKIELCRAAYEFKITTAKAELHPRANYHIWPASLEVWMSGH
jgi:hypothetical protein